MKIYLLLRDAAAQFATVSPTPRLDAELLLSYVLGKDRLYLFSHPEVVLTKIEYQQWQIFIEKRQKKIPIAYLLGQKEFWNLRLEVNEHTLIPRPETEMLVELVLKYCEGGHEKLPLQCLDLGTGSGAIALALAKEKSNWKITATDISQEALNVAKRNAHNNNIDNVCFIQSDWFSSIENKFDIIVSNPPYLTEDDVHLLTEEICHEPRSALVATNNGLADIEKIIQEARDYLNADGYLFLEHGCDQGAAVREVFSCYQYQWAATFQDLSKRDRVTVGKFK